MRWLLAGKKVLWGVSYGEAVNGEPVHQHEEASPTEGVQVMVTKQEEIREGRKELISFYMLGDYWNDLTPEQKDLVKICADHIEERESDMGVVIKGETLGASHPQFADYFTVERLIDE